MVGSIHHIIASTQVNPLSQSCFFALSNINVLKLGYS